MEVCPRAEVHVIIVNIVSRAFIVTLSCAVAANVCVSAVVPLRSRVLSHETKTLNEDKSLNQLVTAPLQKHAVGRSI
jgi:hypothetical protein